MSIGNDSIFDSNEEAAHTLNVVAKGLVHVDDCPYMMRTGVCKVMMEVSCKILLGDEIEENIEPEEKEDTNGMVIQGGFNNNSSKKDKSEKREPGV